MPAPCAKTVLGRTEAQIALELQTAEADVGAVDVGECLHMQTRLEVSPSLCSTQGRSSMVLHSRCTGLAPL